MSQPSMPGSPAQALLGAHASRRRLLQAAPIAAAAAVLPSVLAGCTASPATTPSAGASGGSDVVTVVKNVRPLGGPAKDLVAHRGVLVASVPAGVKVEEIDGRGRLAVPTLVDAHIHPDKTGWGEPWYRREPAQGREKLAAGDVDFAKAMPRPTAERSLGLMKHAVAQGTRAMRAHADVAPAYGLSGVEGLVAAREALKGVLDVQIVAFPQHGVLRTPGTVELLDQAAAGGLLDFVGGIDPVSFDGAHGNQLDVLFPIAEKHGIGLDIHLHDLDEPGLATLRDIVARTRAAGLDGKVTVSHAYSFARLAAPEQQDALADEIAAAGIKLTTVAPTNQNVLPYQRLATKGVQVGLGSDGVRDNWSPFGNADMLHRAWILGWMTRARTDADLQACFDLAAHGGAEVMGLPASDLAVGSPADFMVIEGEGVPQIVVDVPRRDLVLRAGRVVGRDGEFV